MSPYVLGTLPPRIAGQLVTFVTKNREVLLRHWRGEIDTQEILDLLEEVCLTLGGEAASGDGTAPS